MLAGLIRGVLWLLAIPYGLVVWGRNRRYDRTPGMAVEVGVPVVSIGNLTLGGTGKTPMVKWVARSLQQRGVKVAILSRGYKAPQVGDTSTRGGTATKNDEALELEQALPGVPHLQSPDRVAIARQAIGELGSEVLLLDDGFQHRRLARQLDIVLLDATQPFGYGQLFPRGTLRESLVGLQRAQVVCLSRADLISPDERQAIRRQVEQLAPDAKWCEVAHVPRYLLTADGEQQPLDTLAGERVLAFCGIGNPEGFRQTLETIGATVAQWHPFADHHPFTRENLVRLCRLAAHGEVDQIVCTHKDLVKVQDFFATEAGSWGKVPLQAVVVEMEFLCGEERLLAALESLF